MKFSIRALVLMVVLVPTLLAGVAMSASLMRVRVNDLAAELEARGSREASHLANAGQLAMLVGDVDSLRHLARSNLLGVDAAAAVVFLDADGKPMADAGAPGEVQQALACHRGLQSCSMGQQRLLFVRGISVGEATDDPASVFDGEHNGLSPATQLGKVLLSFSPQSLDQAQQRYLFDAMGLTAAVVFLAAMLAIWFSRRLSVPVQQLSDVVARIRTGDLAVRCEPAGLGELRDLETGLNEMADQVAASEAELNRRVDEATASLSEANLILERRNAELDEALHRADEAGRAKDMFLARMSHEMRTPLSSVVSCARLIAGSRDERDREEHVALIRSACDVLLGIIDDVLDYQKIASGRLAIESAPFDLHALVDKVARMMRAQTRGTSLNVVCSIGKDVPRWVRGDELRLNQVLFNLTGNAVKFTQAGSVQLTVERAEEGRIIIEVMDTGIGMTVEQQARLFQPFSQADESTSRRFGGSGLGLAIARAITHAMGGELSLESEFGRGTLARLALPFAEISAGDVQAASVAKRIGGRVDLSVLVVEDNDLNRKLIASELSALGARVDTAESGSAALAQLASAAFDMVVSDVHMPEMDGVALAERVRSRWPDLPVYALTANVVGTELHALIDAGVRGVLHKPFDTEMVRELLLVWSAPAGADELLRSDTGVEAGEVVAELRKLHNLLEAPVGTGTVSPAMADTAHEMLGVARLFACGPLLACCARLNRSLRAGEAWVARHDLARLSYLLDRCEPAE